ncbi:hypothetical protein BOW35_00965 [Solemya velum gill symbiont]|uniref:LysR substrate-binding domain-containing protein n=1 Tax=Solemya velum gill symbiont TaxID=2340 RepID=UPI000996566E|nr:LysR substrate-binding domain-containing protein [Solemya velum gill symbiont]OOZ16108.1 hypothetical protein BOW27_00045 [Solemya velum gill symbiont]OOZ20559.1 hypothetical protein BOW29_00905 [Solemya velum gill symbiont]OOZ23094.1 hypothetical protein BOW30_02825 [Solemya velum gill symbiont]OOZ24391.1 hypothetical protein BOW31_06600 [Solemya velum gill symbiont]OOZ30218.1 hypothetical protein BOW33_01850 [Solemya velum gill symbiont]
MNQQQLACFAKVCSEELNVSRAAAALFTSQPAVSRHLQNLEEALGTPLFERRGRKLIGLTNAGKRTLHHAQVVVAQFEALERIAREERNPRGGTLSISTTHTQSNYLLPDVISEIRHDYPELRFNLHQSMPIQVAEMVASGVANIGIATESVSKHPDLIALPAYSWNRLLLIPKGHPLESIDEITLEDLASYPMVTYVTSMTGRKLMDSAFEKAGLVPDIVIAANDSDTIKAYVNNGIGIGVIAEMAFSDEDAKRFSMRPLKHLFDNNITRVAIRRAYVPSRVELDFLTRLSPYWSEEEIVNIVEMPKEKLKAQIKKIEKSMLKGNDG